MIQSKHKICTKCYIVTDTNGFGKDKKHKDGLTSQCKKCNNTYSLTYRKNNIVKIKLKNSIYYKKNIKKIKRKNSIWSKNNIIKTNTYKKKWKKINTKKVIDAYITYYKNNKEKVKNSQIIYRKANVGKVNAWTAKYRASKLNATPKWLTSEQLYEITKYYIDAILHKQKYGELFHVDHIIPLQGKNVCGLHVPWNLQIITAHKNYKKSNKLIGL